MKHILLHNSFVYKKINKIEPPIGFKYDKKIGAWIGSDNGHLLVKDVNFPSISTKKLDVETGEDNKGQ